MTGYEFEHFAASYLKSIGYHNVQVTQASGDFGIDITATKNGIRYAIQCKYYTHPVGNNAVQEAVAGMAYYDCKKAMVITNSTFTAPAKKLAAANNVTLLENVSPETTHFTKPFSSLKSAILSVTFWILSVISFAASMNLLFRGEIGPCLVGLCFGLPYPIIKVRRFFNSKHRLSDPESFYLENTYIASDTPYPYDSLAFEHKKALLMDTEIDEYELRTLIEIRFSDILDASRDDYLLESIYLAISKQKLSISMLQRYFKIGFMRAASLMDELEKLKVVGSDCGSRPREILITINDLKKQFYDTSSEA